MTKWNNFHVNFLSFSANFTTELPGGFVSSRFPKIPPPKRDFQEAEPARNLDELYAKYDPSIGAGIALSLGALLFYLLASVAAKWTWKRIKSRLQRTKKFSKYFPVKELPPWHVVKKIADEQGIEIPESLLIRLTDRGDLISVATAPLLGFGVDQRRTSLDPRQTSADQRRMSIADRRKLLRHQSELRRISKEIELKSALRNFDSDKKRLSYYGENILAPITVNIISATPMLTPNSSEKRLNSNFDRKSSSGDDFSTRSPQETGENSKHANFYRKENIL